MKFLCDYLIDLILCTQLVRSIEVLLDMDNGQF